MKTKYSYYIIIFSLFLGVISFQLFSDGMFFDGVSYANFSKVMGLHYTGFWSLKNCINCELVYGHPPLAIYLNSLLFRVFGDSIFVERFYSLFTYILSAGIIHLIVKEILPKYKHLSWFVIFVWIIIPLVTWGASNNMLENTMTIFVLLSVLFSLKSQNKNELINIFFAGIFVSLAFLSKGFVGLFPLAIFLWHFLVFKQMSLQKMIINSMMLLLSFLSIFGAIYLFSNNGTQYLIHYFNDQLINGMKNEHTVKHRWDIIFKLFNELIPLAILLALSYFIHRKNKIRYVYTEKKWCVFFFLIGLSGVLPIMVSLKQANFYIIPSLAFFALSAAVFLLPMVAVFISNFEKKNIAKKLKMISFVLLFLSVSIAFFQKGRIGRDKEMIEDVYTIVKIVDTDIELAISDELYWHWPLKSYFYRYGGIDLISDHQNLKKYFLIEKNKNDQNLSHYRKLSISLQKFDLYQLK